MSQENMDIIASDIIAKGVGLEEKRDAVNVFSQELCIEKSIRFLEHKSIVGLEHLNRSIVHLNVKILV